MTPQAAGIDFLDPLELDDRPSQELEEESSAADNKNREDPFLRRVTDGFLGMTMVEPVDYLFADDADTDAMGLSLWDDVDWWTGEEREPPRRFSEERFDKQTSTRKERRIAEEMPDPTDPTSPGAFQVAQARTMPSVKGKLTRDEFVQRMLAKEGLDYQWGYTGGRDPVSGKKAWDCSGIIHAILTNAGHTNFPRHSSAIYAHSKKISLKKAINTRGAILYTEGHIAISLGNGKTIEAGSEASGVNINTAHGRFTHGGWIKELAEDVTKAGGRRRQPRRGGGANRTQSVTAKRGPRRQVGAQDLTATIPIATSGGWADALISLVDDDIEVETPRGKKKVNLSGVPKPTNRDEIVAFARRVARQHGWTGKQWLAVNAIIDGGRVGKWYVPSNKAESHWDPKADNPESTASGIPQRLLSAHPFEPGEREKWKDPRYQIRWLMNYLDQRYDGDPLAALRHKVENGWY